MDTNIVMIWGIDIGLLLIAVSIVGGALRLWRGPTMVDRVVAVDMMTAAIIGFCALFAARTGLTAYLDVALCLALVSFVSVVALARYATMVALKANGAGADDCGPDQESMRK